MTTKTLKNLYPYVDECLSILGHDNGMNRKSKLLLNDRVHSILSAVERMIERNDYLNSNLELVCTGEESESWEVIQYYPLVDLFLNSVFDGHLHETFYRYDDSGCVTGRFQSKTPNFTLQKRK